jgi:hypothetical protein
LAGPSRGGIFISYRRQDASDTAGRLYDRLADRFGDDQIFMDVDTVELGADFAEVIAQAVGTCQVVLVLIGRQWLTATGVDGRRRLDDPDDFVRLEVEAALERGVSVIPILIHGAVMPRHGELPTSLARLARHNALVLRYDSFRADADRLAGVLEGMLADAEVAISAPRDAVYETPTVQAPTPRSYESRPPSETTVGGAIRSLWNQVSKAQQPASGQVRSDYPTSSTLLVFLCHSSSDKPVVRTLHTRLQSDGITPWLDAVDILPGQNWENEIRKAIRRCDVVLVCLSRDSITKVGYIQKEIRQVLDVADEQPENTIFLIPVRLEHCEVPDRLSEYQWVDLFEDDGYGRLMLALTARRNDLNRRRV